MSLLDPRPHFKEFEYDEAKRFYDSQQEVHWLPKEIQLDSDTTDFKIRLTDRERHIIGSILKTFTQSETIIGDYWSNMVGRFFEKAEISMMAKCFSYFETIHANAYDRLNTALNLTNYKAFIEDPMVREKLEHLIDNKKDPKEMTKEEIALSLAVFSAFAEGVNLFSSFAILFSFSLTGRMAGVAQLIKWSVRDESLHSTAGCWLYNQFVKEYPEVLTENLISQLYEAAKMSCTLEENFLNEVFSMGDLDNLNKAQMINMIRSRTNSKLMDLGLKPIYKTDEKLLSEMSWFSVLSAGMEFTDFFATRPTMYIKTEWTTEGAIYE